MVNESAHKRRTLTFNCNNKTQDRRKARKASFDEGKRAEIKNSVDQPEKRYLKALTNIRLKNRNRSIIGQLNKNSI